jgi:hypothetical protein
MRDERAFPKTNAGQSVNEVIYLNVSKGLTSVPKNAELGVFAIV